MDAIDWAALDEVLPTKQIPRDQEKRKEIFNRMDNNNNMSVTLTEAQQGLPALLESKKPKQKGQKSNYIVPLADAKPAAGKAFKVAKELTPASEKSTKKEKQEYRDTVDQREFHAMLVAFRQYVEIGVLFEMLDNSGDKLLHWKEVEPHVKWFERFNITKKQVRAHFKDDWTPCVKYDDFSEWCIQARFGKLELELDENDAADTIKDAAGKGGKSEAEELHALLKAFKEWDVDGNGTITADELAEVLTALDENFTRDQADELFTAADTNKDGVIDYKEFSAWIMS